jgi:uncharacterized protein
LDDNIYFIFFASIWYHFVRFTIKCRVRIRELGGSVLLYIGSFLVVALLVLVYMYREAHRNHVVFSDLEFKDLPEGFNGLKLFFISDIHKRVVSKQLLDQINEKPDLVIIGGDLTEKGVPIAQVKENLERLKQLGPVYFVWGNNDYETDYHQLDVELLSHSVKILDNTALTFEDEQGQKLILMGVDDMNNKRDRLDLALSDADEGFRVLISHDPRIVDKIEKENNIRFVLSGHTHGGQIRLFGFGLYEKGSISIQNGMYVLVSNGYGTTGIPFRLGARAEAHLITLKTTTSP